MTVQGPTPFSPQGVPPAEQKAQQAGAPKPPGSSELSFLEGRIKKIQAQSTYTGIGGFFTYIWEGLKEAFGGGPASLEQNIKARKILEGPLQPDKAIYHSGDRVQAAVTAASESSKWKFQLEQARLHIIDEEWAAARTALESVPEEHREMPEVVLLTGVVHEGRKEINAAFAHYQKLQKSEEKELKDFSTQSNQRLYKTLRSRMGELGSLDKLSVEERKVLAETVDVKNKDEMHKLLDLFNQDKTPQGQKQWAILASSAPKASLRWNDKEQLTFCYLNLFQHKKGAYNAAIACLSDAALEAPTNQKGRLYFDLFKLQGGELHADSDAFSSLKNAAEADPPHPEAKQLFDWVQGAQRRDPESCYAVGECYRNGTHGLSRSDDKAISYYKRAYEAGGQSASEAARAAAGKAAFYVGRLSHNFYITHDYNKEDWYKASAALGDRNGQYALASFYLTEPVINRSDSLSKALHVVEQLVERGEESLRPFRDCLRKALVLPDPNPDDVYNLGDFFCKGVPNLFNPNISLGAAYMRNAAQRRNKG